MRCALLLAAAVLALAARCLHADDESTVVNDTPDFGRMNATFAASADGSATLTLSLNASVLSTLPLAVGRTQLTVLGDALTLPATTARAVTVFDHAELDWNPRGHDPTDGHGLGYGVPHFDMHLYTRGWNASARERIRFGRATANDSADNAGAGVVAPFLVPPPEDLLPSDEALILDPASAVPKQGVHWVPASDWQVVYRATQRTGALGNWSGLSYMLGSFDGSVTFLETMVSLDKLLSLAQHNTSRTDEQDVPQPRGGEDAVREAWGDSAAFPNRYFVSYDAATRSYLFGWRFVNVTTAGA